jgi:hypothetical protein
VLELASFQLVVSKISQPSRHSKGKTSGTFNITTTNKTLDAWRETCPELNRLRLDHEVN